MEKTKKLKICTPVPSFKVEKTKLKIYTWIHSFKMEKVKIKISTPYIHPKPPAY